MLGKAGGWLGGGGAGRVVCREQGLLWAGRKVSLAGYPQAIGLSEEALMSAPESPQLYLDLRGQDVLNVPGIMPNPSAGALHLRIGAARGWKRRCWIVLAIITAEVC